MATRRALVLWASPASKNLGVQVLAHGSAEFLHRAGYASVYFQDFDRGDSAAQLSLKRLALEMIRPGRVANWLKGFDLVFDISGGDSFTSIYGDRRLAQIVLTRLLAHRAGVPVVLGPQTLGPLEGRLRQIIGRSSVKDARAVFARDRDSLHYSTSVLRFGATLTSDLVFALPQPDTTRQVPRDQHAKCLGGSVLVNVSGLLWNSPNASTRSCYRQRMRALLKALVAAGHPALLFPHVLANNSYDDDSAACAALAAEVETSVSVMTPTDVWEARQIVLTADAVIGSRMHACLNALAVGTPAVAWGYSRKFSPLLRDLGWSHSYDISLPVDDLVARTLADVAHFAREREGVQARLAEMRLGAAEKHGEAVMLLASL